MRESEQCRFCSPLLFLCLARCLIHTGINKSLMKENKKDGGKHIMWTGPRVSLQNSSKAFPNNKHAQTHMTTCTHTHTQEPLVFHQRVQ